MFLNEKCKNAMNLEDFVEKNPIVLNLQVNRVLPSDQRFFDSNACSK